MCLPHDGNVLQDQHEAASSLLHPSSSSDRQQLWIEAGEAGDEAAGQEARCAVSLSECRGARFCVCEIEQVSATRACKACLQHPSFRKRKDVAKQGVKFQHGRADVIRRHASVI